MRERTTRRLRDRMPFEALRFAIVGLANTGATLSIIWALMLTGAGPYFANMIGFGAGMTISFFLNRGWTFRVAKRIELKETILFAAASGIAYLGNLTVLAATISLGLEVHLCQIIAMPAYTVLFYTLTKYVVFRPAKNL